MPRPAQDRSQTGPLAALLILLGLLLGSGNAVAAGNGIGAPAARSSLGRQTPTNAILQSAARGTLGDEASAGGGDSADPPVRPALVTRLLWARNQAAPTAAAAPARRQPAGRHYRARAPPAS